MLNSCRLTASVRTGCLSWVRFPAALVVALLFCYGLLGAQSSSAKAKAVPGQTPGTVNLAGIWRFALDPADRGLAEKWHETRLIDAILLPGTTDLAKRSQANTNQQFTLHLSRLHPYQGAAWYQREVNFPADWAGKRVVLYLERTKRTTLWVDGELVGQQDSLGCPHVYDLTKVSSPGTRRLTLRVENARFPYAGGHQLSNDTQTDWNGLLGRLELRVMGRVWIENLQVSTDLESRKAALQVQLGNLTGEPGKGLLEATAVSLKNPKAPVATVSQAVEWLGDGATVEFDLPFSGAVEKWDEFSPALYRLTLALKPEVAAAGLSVLDARVVTFGFRRFESKESRFLINGRPVFLRGKHDACVFPLTGHPPMDVTGWLAYFQTCKEYGINHVRFHSWTPPDAAFDAADQLGIYLQPELYNFGGDLSKEPERAEYTRFEGLRLLRAFGNHPSFVMFALGNEMGGGREVRASIVAEFRKRDPRRLYAQASNYDLGSPSFAEGDDYWTTFRTRAGVDGAVRGSFAHVDAPLGHIQARPPSTTNDYSQALTNVPVPVIGHEVGQYQVYPDYEEIPLYNGVLKPWNLEVFRERLHHRGMPHLAGDYFRASGALAAICYREEVEAALRTPGFGGFQLLDLQDFPGQGTALVGMLNAFMASKGLIEPKRWREFCSETVPLACFSKYTWGVEETFAATLKVAHYGPKNLSQTKVNWKLREKGGRQVASGFLSPAEIPTGTLTELGEIRAPLQKARVPAKLELTLEIAGTPHRNQYDLWAYPTPVLSRPPADVFIGRELDQPALQALARGGRVLLFPAPFKVAKAVPGFFASDFWCYPMFRRGNPPGTLGLLCDPRSPALARFPTESHSNWQWWHILQNSAAFILDEAPVGLYPIVQIIDNFDSDRNHKLGLIFEGNVNGGSLLVCGSDLPSMREDPAACQLFDSLLAYMNSPEFTPSFRIPQQVLQRIIACKP